MKKNCFINKVVSDKYACVFNPYEILGFRDGEDSYCGLLV
jgi:hypothetical protein